MEREILKMTRFTLFVACAATAVTLSSAEARDNCGRGWFFNGVTCVQQERGYAPQPNYGYRPEPRYYQEQPRYYDDGPRYNRGGGGGGSGMYRDGRGQLHCNNPGFTVQDGQCRPYRGG
jgi:hypothetical protein